MKGNWQIWSVIVLAVLDTLASILIYVLLAEKNEFIRHEIFNYAFGSSVFDLVVVSLFRFCILTGACIALMCSGFIAHQRIRQSSKLIVYLSCFIAIYGVFKILYFTEDSHDHMGVRFWLLVSITLVSSISIYCCWRILASKKKFYQKQKLMINDTECEDGSAAEKESLLSENDTESEDGDDDLRKEDEMNELDKEESKKFKTGTAVIKLLKLAKSDIGFILIALFFLTACSVGQIFLPYYTGEVVNYIIIDRDQQKFKTSMLYMALITLFAGFSSGMRGGLFSFVFARYVLRLQNLLFACILRMEIGFFDVRKTGEITSRLTSDCTKIGDSIGLNVNVFLRNVVKIIGILVFMLKISWKLSIVTLVSIPIIAIFSELFGEKYRKLSEKVQTSLAHANESAEEAISSIRTVRSFAAENNEIDRYKKRLKVTYALRKKEAVLLCGYRWCTELTDLAMSLLILYYGGHLVIRNDLSGGHLISFILYSFELGFAFEEIGDVYTGLMEAVGASKNVLVYIERKPKVKCDGTIIPENDVSGEVQFKDVSFSYPSRPDIPVLKDVNFSAKKGEVVALVGPSGGGKSSIVNLLERFYNPTGGHILVDGVRIHEYDHKFIHEKMSLVQQEPVLFARTVTENIAYGLSKSVTEETVQNSAAMANAHTFIEELPERYETETGEKGVQLSGGQKQRIAIARALIRNPAILILDEATSALDSESEYLVQQAINKNLVGRTVIVIAHRLSTIEKADKILVIEKGRLVEQGKHLDLIDKDGLYAGLVKRQALAIDDTVEPKEILAVDIPLQRQHSRTSHGTASPPKSSFSKSDIRM